MAGVRSAIVAKRHLPDQTGVTLYAPPADITAIIKTIYAVNTGATVTTLYVSLVDSAGLVLNIVQNEIQPANIFSWTGWVVLEFETAITAQAQSPDVIVWISGALLPEVPP